MFLLIMAYTENALKELKKHSIISIILSLQNRESNCVDKFYITSDKLW